MSEPTLNEKLTLLAEKCPGLGLGVVLGGLWLITFTDNIGEDFVLDSTDGKALFKDRVVRELEKAGKCAIPYPDALEVFESVAAFTKWTSTCCLEKSDYDAPASYTAEKYPNEVERYATALYEVVEG